MKPLRKIAMVLAIVAGLELYGILALPTYEAELNTARAEYEAALLENQMLAGINP